MNGRRRLRVLMVDDELIPDAEGPGNGYMWYYSKAFRDHGHTVVEVNNADSVAAILKKDPFDLVVLDVMMNLGSFISDIQSVYSVKELCAGAILADWVYANYPDMPIVFLSVRNRATLEELKSKPNVRRVFTKRHSPPFEFVKEVEGILAMA